MYIQGFNMVFSKKMLRQFLSKVKNWPVIRYPISQIGNFFKSQNTYSQIQHNLEENSEVVLVYQMGKVGSSTIVKSLEASNLSQPIYKVHFLNPDINKKRWENQKSYKNLLAPNYLIIDQYFCENIDNLVAQKEKIKIITSVRDPIARGISSFFQNITHFFPNVYRKLENKEIDIEDLIQMYWEDPEAEERRYRALNWFDQELNSILDIDVFSMDFPKSQGYAIERNIKTGIDILVIKLEKFSPCLETGLKDFLSLEQMSMVNANVAKSKRYYEIYNEFKNKINFSPESLDRVYNSQFMKHFYTDEEIDSLRGKWSKSA